MSRSEIIKRAWATRYARYGEKGRAKTKTVAEIRAYIEDNSMPIPECGCIVWMGFLRKDGYGIVGANGELFRVHRLVYEIDRGPIPGGLDLDHKCRVRSCWNPNHLEPVTNQENIRRGMNIAGRRFRQTHCKNGHEFTPENTARSPQGWRSCRVCRAANCRRRYAKRQAA